MSIMNALKAKQFHSNNMTNILTQRRRHSPLLSFQAKLNLTPCKKERAESSPAGYSVLTKPDQHKYTQLYKQELGTKVRHSCCVFRAQAHLGRGGSAQEKYSADRLRMASIVDTNWQNFLAPDSDLPPDVVFLVKADGIERFFGALPGWS